MNAVLWVATGLLAAAFLATGLLKIVRTKEQLAAAGLGWTEDFSARTVTLIGVLEVLAVLGLILPAVTGIAQVLVPVAATGLALVMLGAIATHARRREWPLLVANVVLLALAVLVAWGRFGPYAF